MRRRERRRSKSSSIKLSIPSLREVAPMLETTAPLPPFFCLLALLFPPLLAPSPVEDAAVSAVAPAEERLAILSLSLRRPPWAFHPDSLRV
ncbi:hypothetical protein SDJN03_26998, partial [Cucurbita argyrosperma subsp. sororia]